MSGVAVDTFHRAVERFLDIVSHEPCNLHTIERGKVEGEESVL